MTHREYRHTADWPYHISCGGVLFKQTASSLLVIILARHERDGSSTYHLPKGTLHHDETLEHCALREIEEESGQTGTIVGYIGAYSDDYLIRGTAISKTTHYFAVKWDREVGPHDDEHDEVLWQDVSSARALLEHTQPLKKEWLILDRLVALLQKKSQSL